MEPKRNVRLNVIIPLAYQSTQSLVHGSSFAPARGSLKHGRIQCIQVPFKVPSRGWQRPGLRAMPYFQTGNVLNDGGLGYAVDLEIAHRPSSHYNLDQTRRWGNRGGGSNTKKQCDKPRVCVPRTSQTSSYGSLNSSLPGPAWFKATGSVHSNENLEGGGMMAEALVEERSSDEEDSGPLAMTRVLERVHEVPQVMGINALEVLLLRGNDLADFDALEACPRLRYVDISFNRVRRLPRPSFFKGNPGPAGLETLLCDHNYISEWESTRMSIEAAQSLLVLTLARNPIAWSGDYRAAVTNTTPNLKLFDRHPVAEEELIEGANFSFTRFAAPNLCELDFAGMKSAAASLGGESKLVEHARLVSKIASRLSYALSPCATIQRGYRAYRKRHRKTVIGHIRRKSLAQAIAVVRLDKARAAAKRRFAARKIQAVVRRYITNAAATMDLCELLQAEEKSHLTLIEMVDCVQVLPANDAADVLAAFESEFSSMYFDMASDQIAGAIKEDLPRYSSGTGIGCTPLRRKRQSNFIMPMLGAYARRTAWMTSSLGRHFNASRKICIWYRRHAESLRILEQQCGFRGLGGKTGGGVLFVDGSAPLIAEALSSVLLLAHKRIGYVSESESESQSRSEASDLDDDMTKAIERKKASLKARYIHDPEQWIEKFFGFSKVKMWNEHQAKLAQLPPTIGNVLGNTNEKFFKEGGGAISFCSPSRRPVWEGGCDEPGWINEDVTTKTMRGRALMPLNPRETRQKLRGLTHEARKYRSAAIKSAKQVKSSTRACWWHCARAPTPQLLLRAVRHSRIKARRRKVTVAFLWRSDAIPAAKIQAAVRGWRGREAFRPLVFAHAILRRAGFTLCRWWRNRGASSLHRRHKQLSMWKRVSQETNAEVLYIEPELYYAFVGLDGAFRARSVDSVRPPAPIVTEFGINAWNQVVVMSSVGLIDSHQATPKIFTRGSTLGKGRLPRMVSDFAPPKYPESSNIYKPNMGDVKTLLTSRVEASIVLVKVPERSLQYTQADLRKSKGLVQPRLLLPGQGALTIGCQISDPVSQEGEKISNRPKSKLLRLIALKFDSALEARNRAGALLMLTWDHSRRNFTPLFSRSALERNSFCGGAVPLRSDWLIKERQLKPADHVQIEFLCQSLAPRVLLPMPQQPDAFVGATMKALVPEAAGELIPTIQKQKIDLFEFITSVPPDSSRPGSALVISQPQSETCWMSKSVSKGEECRNAELAVLAMPLSARLDDRQRPSRKLGPRGKRLCAAAGSINLQSRFGKGMFGGTSVTTLNLPRQQDVNDSTRYSGAFTKLEHCIRAKVQSLEREQELKRNRMEAAKIRQDKKHPHYKTLVQFVHKQKFGGLAKVATSYERAKTATASVPKVLPHAPYPDKMEGHLENVFSVSHSMTKPSELEVSSGSKCSAILQVQTPAEANPLEVLHPYIEEEISRTGSFVVLSCTKPVETKTYYDDSISGNSDADTSGWLKEICSDATLDPLLIGSAIRSTKVDAAPLNPSSQESPPLESAPTLTDSELSFQAAGNLNSQEPVVIPTVYFACRRRAVELVGHWTAKKRLECEALRRRDAEQQDLAEQLVKEQKRMSLANKLKAMEQLEDRVFRAKYRVNDDKVSLARQSLSIQQTRKREVAAARAKVVATKLETDQRNGAKLVARRFGSHVALARRHHRTEAIVNAKRDTTEKFHVHASKQRKESEDSKRTAGAKKRLLVDQRQEEALKSRFVLQQQHEVVMQEIHATKMAMVNNRRICGQLREDRRKREKHNERKACYPTTPRYSPTNKLYPRGISPRCCDNAHFSGALTADSTGFTDGPLSSSSYYQDHNIVVDPISPPISLASALDFLLPIHEPPPPPDGITLLDLAVNVKGVIFP